jgi:hypothetical protein
MGLARIIFPGSILTAIYITFSKFGEWGIGSIFAGIGIFVVGAFISYLLSGGQNLE